MSLQDLNLNIREEKELKELHDKFLRNQHMNFRNKLKVIVSEEMFTRIFAYLKNKGYDISRITYFSFARNTDWNKKLSKRKRNVNPIIKKELKHIKENENKPESYMEDQEHNLLGTMICRYIETDEFEPSNLIELRFEFFSYKDDDGKIQEDVEIYTSKLIDKHGIYTFPT